MTNPATHPHDIIASHRVQGSAVYNQDGEELGSIDTLMIDKHSGQVCYAVMEFGGFLGIGTDRYPLPWSVLKYDTKLGGYVVPMDKARVEGAPKYAGDSNPAYDPVYSKQIDTYYAV